MVSKEPVKTVSVGNAGQRIQIDQPIQLPRFGRERTKQCQIPEKKKQEADNGYIQQHRDKSVKERLILQPESFFAKTG